MAPLDEGAGLSARAWARVPLSSICQTSRATIEPGAPDYDRLPSVGLEQVESGTGTIRLETGARSGDGRSVNFLFDQRHVLYGKLRPYLNKVALPDFAGRCSTELVPLLPGPEVRREFLALLLRRRTTVDTVMAANTGARMPRADIAVLLALRVPLPPLAAQRRITKVLAQAEGIGRMRREALDLTRAIAPALFIRMFGDPGTNPMGWPVSALGEVVAESRYGPRFHDRPYAEDGAAVLRTTDIRPGGHVRWEDAPRLALTDVETARYGLPSDTLLVTRTGATIGKLALFKNAPIPCVAGAYLIEFRFSRHVVPEFVLAALQTSYGQASLLSGSRAVAQPNINANAVKAISVPLPPFHLQQAFAARLADLQNTISDRERAVAATFQMEAALAARLLG